MALLRENDFVDKFKVQDSISKTKVLIFGAGILGCEVVKNLALSGFKEIKIVDHEPVLQTDVDSQTLFTSNDVGKNRSSVAAKICLIFEPKMKVASCTDRLESFSGKDGIKRIEGFNVVIQTVKDNKMCKSIRSLSSRANIPYILVKNSDGEGSVSMLDKGLTHVFKSLTYESGKKTEYVYANATLARLTVLHIFSNLMCKYADSTEEGNTDSISQNPPAAEYVKDNSLSTESNITKKLEYLMYKKKFDQVYIEADKFMLEASSSKVQVPSAVFVLYAEAVHFLFDGRKEEDAVHNRKIAIDLLQVFIDQQNTEILKTMTNFEENFIRAFIVKSQLHYDMNDIKCSISTLHVLRNYLEKDEGHYCNYLVKIYEKLGFLNLSFSEILMEQISDSGQASTEVTPNSLADLKKILKDRQRIFNLEFGDLYTSDFVKNLPSLLNLLEERSNLLPRQSFTIVESNEAKMIKYNLLLIADTENHKGKFSRCRTLIMEKNPLVCIIHHPVIGTGFFEDYYLEQLNRRYHRSDDDIEDKSTIQTLILVRKVTENENPVRSVHSSSYCTKITVHSDLFYKPLHVIGLSTIESRSCNYNDQFKKVQNGLRNAKGFPLFAAFSVGTKSSEAFKNMALKVKQDFNLYNVCATGENMKEKVLLVSYATLKEFWPGEVSCDVENEDFHMKVLTIKNKV